MGRSGLLGVLAAKELGAERIIAMSRHADRQALAIEFGATDIVVERGNEGVAAVKELTGGYGAHSVIEAVGTQESMMQAIRATRPGGHVGYVGVAHGVSLPGEELFFSGVHLHGGPAPVRRFLPDLIDRIWNRQIDPGKVFDLTLPLEQAAAGLPGDGPTHRHQGPAHPLTMTRTTTPGPRRTTRARPPLLAVLAAGVLLTAACSGQDTHRPGRFHQPGCGRGDPIRHPHSRDVSDPTHLRSRSTDGHPHLHRRASSCAAPSTTRPPPATSPPCSR